LTVLRSDFKCQKEDCEKNQIEYDSIDIQKEKELEEVHNVYEMNKQLALQQVENKFKKRSDALKERIKTNGEALSRDGSYLLTFNEDVNDQKRKWDSSKAEVEEWRTFSQVQNGVCGALLPGNHRKQQNELAGAKISLKHTKKVIYDTLADLMNDLKAGFDSVEEFIIHGMNMTQILCILTALNNHGVAYNPEFHYDNKWIATTRKTLKGSTKESKVLLACRMIRTLTPSGEQLSDYVRGIENDAMKDLLDSHDEEDSMTLSSQKRKPFFDRKYATAVEQELQESAKKRTRSETQTSPTKPSPVEDPEPIIYQDEYANITWQFKTPEKP
jgi:hypothetical protein